MVSNGSKTSARPVIGLTTYREPAKTTVWDTDFALLQHGYVDGIVRVGGVAVLLPPQPSGVRAVLDRVDGLVLCGGADVDPARYGQPASERTGATRTDRDEWEFALLREALARDVPTLGVCRGAQVLNIALGGTLQQHLPDRINSRSHQPSPGRFGPNVARVVNPSLLATILGGADVAVQCHHHQAVDKLAAGLNAVAFAADGTIEAVESPAHRFMLGVQWHPEQDLADLRLFAAVVEAAAGTGPADSTPATPAVTRKAVR